jgi:hypothetical protein
MKLNRILAGLALAVCLCGAANAATLLPNGKQQFLSSNGAPLAGGTIQFYIPGTTTPKDTWQVCQHRLVGRCQRWLFQFADGYGDQFQRR